MNDDLQRAYDRLKEEFAYYTECQLATLEHFEMLKKPPQGQMKRAQSIASKMLLVCKVHSIKPGKNIRLRDRLTANS